MKRFFYLFTLLTPFILHAQNVTDFIVVDQFGYLPDAQKIAIIRSPEIGYDAAENFVPGRTYAVCDAATKRQVYRGAPVLWNDGLVDSSSGDKVWHFDFSAFTKEGTYYIYDIGKRVKSYDFVISNDVYKSVLKHAFRTFYYQRSGFEKHAKFAGSAWADKASHIRKRQDKECREYGKEKDASTERDVHGGWYDAGDYNKYTNWTADYIVYLLLAYEENPKAWTDDFGIPESGNGIPDILDEVKFGLEHLLRLQFPSGALISVVSCAHGSPPSSAKDPSLWGGPSTSSTLSAAYAYAYGAKIFKKIDPAFASTLQQSAIKAWDWANRNPEILFYNNSSEHGTVGLAAGQQEVNDLERTEKKIHAAMRLFDLTGEDTYKTFFEQNYMKARLIAWELVFPFGEANQDMLLYYTSLPNANPTIASHIKSIYTKGIDTTYNLHCVVNQKDPYFAYQKDYVWGSNGTKAKQGNIFYNLLQYSIMPEIHDTIRSIASAYIHYLHGRNPLNMCYLTNMNEFGADKSVTQLYHYWFTHGCKKWDEAGVSTYGPAPGFLVGGPNPAYDWDGCCPKNCDSEANNAMCFEVDVSVLKNQPAQKSYLDFNHGWPLNSWAISENSCGYQVQYLRLLSKFVQ